MKKSSRHEETAPRFLTAEGKLPIYSAETLTSTDALKYYRHYQVSLFSSLSVTF